MKKLLILTVGIALSACSSNGQNASQYQLADSAHHNSAGLYQMPGGCAAVRVPCQPAPNPCAPVSVSPCAQSQYGQFTQTAGGAGGGFPWALGGAALGAGTLAYLHNNNSKPNVPVKHYQNTVRPAQVQQVKYLQQAQLHKASNINGLRPAYKAEKLQYVYGNIGAVNQEAGEKLVGIQTRLGYQSASIFGAEIEGTKSIADAKNIKAADLALGQSKLVAVDRSIAGFALARIPMTGKLNALARAGVHNSKATYASRCSLMASSSSGGTVVSGSGAGTSVGGTSGTSTGSSACVGTAQTSSTHTGMAFGGGVEAALTPVDSIRADVTAYDMGDKYTKAVSVGYLRKF